MSTLLDTTEDQALTAAEYLQEIKARENLEVLDSALMAARIAGPPPAEGYVVSPEGAREPGDAYVPDGSLIAKLASELPAPSTLPKLSGDFGGAASSQPSPSYNHDLTLEA